MRIDIGSFVFNCDVSQPGSTPSWGTSLGQGEGYKIKEEYDDIMTAMIYNAIEDKENIDCPLGQGGKGIQSGTHEIVIASKFSKVYVNNRLIKDAEFILLIVKEHTDHHDGRLTLKYNKNIKYNGSKYLGGSNINELCIKAIIKSFNLTEKSSWGVYEIRIKNQDELHFSIIIIDDKDKKIYLSSNERKSEFDIRIKLNDPSVSIEERFKSYLKIYEKSESYISSIIGAFKHDESIKTLNKKMELEINSIFDVLEYNLVDRISKCINENEKEIAIESGFEKGRVYYGYLKTGLPYYANFLKMQIEKKPVYNCIIYGIPGVGKSYEIRKVKNEYYQARTIFHPEYTNADFVGQLLPVKKTNNNDSSNENKISYEFIPGPFTRILAKALNDPDGKYMLVIDEINRGNAAAIFGEIFQLLDRNEEGRSEYSIHNEDIYNCLIEEFHIEEKLLKDGIFIPENLYIWATMNTSDQNVYTLDTAFQRRWQMEMLTIDFEKGETKEHGEIKIPISKEELTWKEFVTAINEEISNRNEGMISVEDKRIGPWFLRRNEIEDKNLFTQKVIKYLWDDAFKMSRAEVFKKVKNLDEIVDKINKGSNIEDIFNQEIFEKVLNNRNVNNKDNQKTEIEDTNE